MSKFNAGDRVEAVNPYNKRLPVGSVVTVTRCGDDYLDYKDDNGNTGNWAVHRFKLASEAKPKKKKRLFKDDTLVYVKKTQKIGKVTGYRKGNKFPYVVTTEGKKSYHSWKGLLTCKTKPEVVTETVEKVVEVEKIKVVYKDRPVEKVKSTKENKIMATVNNLREKVRAALRSPEETMLIRTGFIYESGALTKEGRKVVADLQFEGVENGELRARIVELAEALEADAKKASK